MREDELSLRQAIIGFVAIAVIYLFVAHLDYLQTL